MESGWSRGRILGAAAFPAIVLGGILAGEFVRAKGQWIPPCVIHEATGWHCPGCGGTRAFLALGDFDPVLAVRMNPLGTVLILLLLAMAFRLSWEAVFPRLKWRRFPMSDRAVTGVVVAIVAFGLLRNLPWWPFTLLAPH